MSDFKVGQIVRRAGSVIDLEVIRFLEDGKCECKDLYDGSVDIYNTGELYPAEKVSALLDWSQSRDLNTSKIGRRDMKP